VALRAGDALLSTVPDLCERNQDLDVLTAVGESPSVQKRACIKSIPNALSLALVPKESSPDRLAQI
jgi:hypothetical protein